MDANRYATKKTIAQGMLDIALLTANASQLKYILQVGERHEFYTLMLILISVSIIMQVNKIYISFIFRSTHSESQHTHKQKTHLIRNRFGIIWNKKKDDSHCRSHTKQLSFVCAVVLHILRVFLVFIFFFTFFTRHFAAPSWHRECFI